MDHVMIWNVFKVDSNMTTVDALSDDKIIENNLSY